MSRPGRRRAVFLDRDGILNRAVVRDGLPYPPRALDDLQILDGVPEACGQLRDAGLTLIVVTNQPDVARGTATMEDIAAFNAELLRRIPVDEILVCAHDDQDGCDCRKPSPGMLLRAAERWRIALDESVMVGDRWRDVEAGRRAGCRTVFVDAGYAERRPDGPDVTVQSLPEAVPWILETCLSGEGTNR